MCMTVPGKVIEVGDDYALVEFPENKPIKVSIEAHKPEKGDWVLVYSGFVIETIDDKRAVEIINTFKSVGGCCGEN